MNLPHFVDLCSSDETEEKKEKNANFKEHTSAAKEKASDKNADGCYGVGQGCEENRCRNIINGVIDLSHSMDRRILSANAFHTPFSDCSMPICRQFWKAGDYEARSALETSFRSCQNRMRVHPKFLHSNATSHKWAFGAIAELLDNAIDEVQNGATFVTLDKITNSQDGNPAILVQDDGGGMDPESLRCCMSFGFSDKQSDSSIGQYGNGFKTSTMRLGADVIVFSRCMSNRTLTQSVGLLSYTFLRLTSSDDVVVPMVDYEFNQLTGGFERLLRNGQKQFSSNLATLLKWSPFRRESELLKQFSDIGLHGTKVIVFNLWDNDDGDPELDFDSDPEDIMITGASQIVQLNDVKRMPRAQMHVANRLFYSLRVYSSILYLHMPQNFSIILRGQVVKPHQIAKDLKYCECIKYKPQCEEKAEAVVVTTIGFLKDAPKVDIHGFSVYHRNRLILPFWRVVGNTRIKGKGVAGILEANFIKPTHDKQDFEKSTLYQKLELRLRDMTFEYWDYHCHLVGYTSTKLRRAPQEPTTESGMYNGFEQIVLNNNVSGPPGQLSINLGPLTLNPGSLTVNSSEMIPVTGASMDPGGRFCHHISAGSQIVTALSAPPSSTLERSTTCNGVSQAGLLQKRRHENLSETASLKRQAMENGIAAGLGRITSAQLLQGHGHRQSQEIVTMVQFNKKLHAECKELERTESQLLVKVQKLRSELQEVQRLYEILSSQLKLTDEAKVETVEW